MPDSDPRPASKGRRNITRSAVACGSCRDRKSSKSCLSNLLKTAALLSAKTLKAPPRYRLLLIYLLTRVECDGRPQSPQTPCSLCRRLGLECNFAAFDARKWWVIPKLSTSYETEASGQAFIKIPGATSPRANRKIGRSAQRKEW